MNIKHGLAALLFLGSGLTASTAVLAYDDNMPPRMRAQMKSDDERHAQWQAMIAEQHKMDDRHLQDQRAMEDRHYKERNAMLDKQKQERDAMFEKMYPMNDGMSQKAPPKR